MVTLLSFVPLSPQAAPGNKGKSPILRLVLVTWVTALALMASGWLIIIFEHVVGWKPGNQAVRIVQLTVNRLYVKESNVLSLG